MSLGENLRALRKNKGWTQGDLSDRSGIKLTHISKIENNNSDPKLSTLQKIIDALGCNADELIFNKSLSGTQAILENYLKKTLSLPVRERATLITIIEKFLLAERMTQARESDIPAELWETFNDIKKEEFDAREQEQLEDIIHEETSNERLVKQYEHQGKEK